MSGNEEVIFARDMSGNCQGNLSSRFGRQPVLSVVLNTIYLLVHSAICDIRPGLDAVLFMRRT